MAAPRAVAEARRVHPKEHLAALLPRVLWTRWVHLRELGQQRCQGGLRAKSQQVVEVPSRPRGQTSPLQLRLATAMEEGPSCLSQLAGMAAVVVEVL